MTLVKKTIELDQEQINRIKTALNAKTEKEAINKVLMYLAHPVLHELWIGARGNAEVKHLTAFSRGFIRLGRLITPEP